MAEQSDPKTVGVYRIDTWSLDNLQASMSLKEIKTNLGNIPINSFDATTFPNAPQDIIGDLIPVAFGVVKGLKAFPIDPGANKFKVLDHSIESFDGFQTRDGDAFIPDSANLSTTEFIWSGWDGEADLFVDLTAEGENPVDCVKLLLTDSVKGAGLPLTDLDTTSTGNKGFGANGTRLEYIYANRDLPAKEIVEFPIGLYAETNKAILRYIEQVLAASFGIMYVNLEGKYQIKSWKVETSEGLDEVKDANIRSPIRTSIVATDTFTRIVSKFGERHSNNDFQTAEFTDDRLRQLRGLAQHKTLEQRLPISGRFGAQYWAERSVGMRSVPRRILKVDVTQEFMLKEPGDYVRVVSDRDGIDEVFEVLSVTISPGSLPVTLKLIDNRGHGLQPGFWVGDALLFPDRLGGTSADPWDDTWTAEQKKWAAENSGYWGSDEDYIDKTDDTADSYRKSVWV